MRRLICGFASPTYHIVGNLMSRLMLVLNIDSLCRYKSLWILKFSSSEASCFGSSLFSKSEYRILKSYGHSAVFIKLYMVLKYMY